MTEGKEDVEDIMIAHSETKQVSDVVCITHQPNNQEVLILERIVTH